MRPLGKITSLNHHSRPIGGTATAVSGAFVFNGAYAVSMQKLCKPNSDSIYGHKSTVFSVNTVLCTMLNIILYTMPYKMLYTMLYIQVSRDCVSGLADMYNSAACHVI